MNIAFVLELIRFFFMPTATFVRYSGAVSLRNGILLEEITCVCMRARARPYQTSLVEDYESMLLISI